MFNQTIKAHGRRPFNGTIQNSDIQIFHKVFDTPYGKVYLRASADKLSQVIFVNDQCITGENIRIKSHLLIEAEKQIIEYLKKERFSFDLPFSLEGTRFQLNVWQEALKIPYGETASYKDIAKKIGSPQAFRAVGAALKENPVQLLIPCHRVISTNGNLGGYAGGKLVKKSLLSLERVKHSKFSNIQSI